MIIGKNDDVNARALLLFRFSGNRVMGRPLFRPQDMSISPPAELPHVPSRHTRGAPRNNPGSVCGADSQAGWPAVEQGIRGPLILGRVSRARAGWRDRVHPAGYYGVGQSQISGRVVSGSAGWRAVGQSQILGRVPGGPGRVAGVLQS